MSIWLNKIELGITKNQFELKAQTFVWQKTKQNCPSGSEGIARILW